LNRKKLFVVCTYGKRKEKNKAPYSNTFGSYPTPPKKTQGVCHIVSLPFTIKSYLIKAKEEELWKPKYISPCKNIPNLQKNPLPKRNQKSFKILL
jgi:hypothetical protein